MEGPQDLSVRTIIIYSHLKSRIRGTSLRAHSSASYHTLCQGSCALKKGYFFNKENFRNVLLPADEFTTSIPKVRPGSGLPVHFSQKIRLLEQLYSIICIQKMP